MRGDDPPGALHQELHAERADDEEGEGRCERPEREDDEPTREGRDHGRATSDTIRGESEQDATPDRADHRDRRECRTPRRRESPVALEEGRVHVLCAVRDRIEGRHEQRERVARGHLQVAPEEGQEGGHSRSSLPVRWM